MADPLELELLRHREKGGLQVEARVVNLANRKRTVRLEAVEPAVVVLGLQEYPTVLRTGIDRDDAVVRRSTVTSGASAPASKTFTPSASLMVVSSEPPVEVVKRCSGLRAVETPNRVATFSCISQSP
jgi:hypothetical protein